MNQLITTTSRLLWVLPALLAAPVMAAPSTFTWNGGSGVFQSGNWTETLGPDDVAGIFPNDDDDSTVYNTAGAQTITFNSNALSGGTHLIQGTAAVTFDLAGFRYDQFSLNNGGGNTFFIGTSNGDNAGFTLQTSAANGTLRNASTTALSPTTIGGGTGVGTVLVTDT